MGDPRRSTKNGNTKHFSKRKLCRHWFLTLNNYTNEDIQNLLNCDPKIHRFVFQAEEGENKTPHLQGYFDFGKGHKGDIIKYMSEQLGHKRCHWENTREPDLAIKYCQKKEGRIAGPWYRNILKPQPKFIVNIQLYNWQKSIIELLRVQPDNRTIHWFWEADGCTGKTTFAKYILQHFTDVLVSGGRLTDMKNQILTYREHTGRYPKIMILDIPRGGQSIVDYRGIEKIKDMLFYSSKYEGGMVCGPSPHVLIFANFEPLYNEISNDQWRVSNIKNGRIWI